MAMKSKKRTHKQILLNVVFIILCALVIYPFLMLVSVSFSNENAIVEYGYRLWPKKFDLAAYKYVFANPKNLINAYKITGFTSIVAMILGTLLMAMVAYPLSKPNFKGRRGVSFYLYFTMLFSGGLVPTYILITKYLNLTDNILVYILPGLISPWYVFILRTFFAGLPKEISESVFMDGGNEYVIFFKFILPLSLPALFTIALFVFLNKWNDWNTSMLYINESSLFTLQYMLQRILQNVEMLRADNMSANLMTSQMELPAETTRMAMAVVVAGPALIVFPFFQKYFVEGLTVGSVKG